MAREERIVRLSSLEVEKMKIGEPSGERGSEERAEWSRPGQGSDQLTETTEMVLEVRVHVPPGCFCTSRADLCSRVRTDQSELPS